MRNKASPFKERCPETHKNGILPENNSVGCLLVEIAATWAPVVDLPFLGAHFQSVFEIGPETAKNRIMPKTLRSWNYWGPFRWIHLWGQDYWRVTARGWQEDAKVAKAL